MGYSAVISACAKGSEWPLALQPPGFRPAAVDCEALACLQQGSNCCNWVGSGLYSLRSSRFIHQVPPRRSTKLVVAMPGHQRTFQIR